MRWRASMLIAFLPLAGLLVLVAAPDTDVRWEHHPSHFWIVLVAAGLPAGLAWTLGNAGRRRSDARLFLVSLAFVTAAAFLGLHALATPGVMLDHANTGFVVAVPIGLALSSLAAAMSTREIDGRHAASFMLRASWWRLGLLVAVGLWAIASLAQVPPLDATEPPEARNGWLIAVGVVAVAGFAWSAWRFGALAARRRSFLLASVAVAWILLAQAALAGVLARNWHASWWEWHVLIVSAFAVVFVASRRLPDTERFGDLYLDTVRGSDREVSVLFADLASFTGFSEQHDPDVVQEMLNHYYNVVLPAVRSSGGHVDKLIGDAVMATFNVADPQPDHAARACRAALAMRDAARAVADAHPGWPRFRIGVHTGVARVGLVGGATDRDYTAVGDTVNLASRLESIAPVDGIALSGSTVAAVPGATVRHLGQTKVKGRAESVDVWQLVDL